MTEKGKRRKVRRNAPLIVDYRPAVGRGRGGN